MIDELMMKMSQQYRCELQNGFNSTCKVFKIRTLPMPTQAVA